MRTSPQYLTALHSPQGASVLEPLSHEFEQAGQHALAQVQEALNTERPGFRYGDHWFALAGRLEWVARQGLTSLHRDWATRNGAKLNIALHFDITSKDNFTAEWTTDSQEAARSLTVSALMGYYRPNRLVQLPLGCELMGFTSPRQLRYLQGDADSGWRLVVRAAHYALASYFAKLAQVCNIVETSSDVVLFEYENQLLLRKVQRYSDTPDATKGPTEPVEELTGFLDHTLLTYLPLFDWRALGGASWDRWCSMLVNAGGRDPRRYPDDVAKTIATAFYRQHDEDEQRLQDALEKSEHIHAAANKIHVARAYLKTLNIGHRSGWNSLFAKELGIHTTDVKRWMKKNLPDMFDQIYPPGSRTAQPLRSTGS